MRINNNFNVLPFYDSLQKQNSKKWYSFGQHYPLICPNNTILPFQFITDSEVTVSSNIEAVNVHSGKVTNLGVKPSVSKGTQADATYYIVKMVETTISAMPEGLHYLRINTNKGYLYSEEFTYNANHEECIKIEYWNENTLNFNSGEINFDDDFRFILYIPSTIGKPEYEFEEELTKRLGYKFIESQTSNKIYKFNFLAPEYICDAMRLIRLCDYIKLTTKFDTFNALSFAYEPKWQDNGDLAAVDVEFDTDCIIQKLESFNRRLKESFYNALLADIDEPVLFSNDIVAQYYTEFTTTSYINGKLIRQLEAINEAELGSLENLVLPIDNQADTEQKAKKITLASLKNVLIKLADYVTLSTAQNINGEKNFIGGLKVNGSPIIYDSVNKCWKLQGNLVLTGGITMYADDGTLNLPSIYDGLPIDGTTIYWDTDAAGNRVLKAVGGGGTADSVAWSNITGKPSWIGSSKPTYSYSEIQNTPDLNQYALQTALDTTNTEVAKKWTKDNSKIANWDSAFGWGNHANAGYVKKTYVDETFVNLTGEQTISGKKNFTTGGLFVNGSQIKYDSTKKYWKLEGDLLVTGGITMYGNEGTYTPSTIMDAIAVDGTTISKSGGVLKVIGGTGGGSVEGLASVAYSGKYDDLIGKPTLLSSFTDDIVSGKYLPLSGGTISGDFGALNIKRNESAKPSLIKFTNNDGTLGMLGMSDSYEPIVYKGSAQSNPNTLIHSGNYSSYTLPLSGGTIQGVFGCLEIKRTEEFATAIKFSNANGVLGYIGYNDDNTPCVWDVSMLNRGVIIHSLGGTIDSDFGAFSIKRNNPYASAIKFENANGVLGYLGFNDDYTIKIWDNKQSNPNNIWHSGNDGSGSGLDADLLDGKHDGELTAQFFSRGKLLTKSNTINTLMSGVYSYINGDNPTGAIDDNVILLAFRNSERSDMIQLAGAANTENLYYRRAANVGNSNESWMSWKTIAFTSSNVASATKLQTARTIWGQSFDGTGNVSGTLSSVSGIQFANHGSGAFYINAYGNFIASSNSDNYNWAVARYDGTACISVKASSGNVGVGTTNPSSKLHVSGDILATGGITMYSMRALKNVVDERGLSLNELSTIKPTRYTWKDGRDNRLHIGGIADDIQQVLPEVVYKTNDGVLTMDYGNAAFAIASSLIQPVVDHEKRIAILEEENKQLRQEVELLKAS